MQAEGRAEQAVDGADGEPGEGEPPEEGGGGEGRFTVVSCGSRGEGRMMPQDAEKSNGRGGSMLPSG